MRMITKYSKKDLLSDDWIINTERVKEKLTAIDKIKAIR